jgi:inorganic pyrophosphatase
MAKHKLIEVRQFFESYKALEKKNVEIAGVFDQNEAMKIIHESIAFYTENKAKLLAKI